MATKRKTLGERVARKAINLEHDGSQRIVHLNGFAFERFGDKPRELRDELRKVLAALIDREAKKGADHA